MSVVTARAGSHISVKRTCRAHCCSLGCTASRARVRAATCAAVGEETEADARVAKRGVHAYAHLEQEDMKIMGCLGAHAHNESRAQLIIFVRARTHYVNVKRTVLKWKKNW